jgi:hypothetical protein
MAGESGSTHRAFGEPDQGLGKRSAIEPPLAKELIDVDGRSARTP